MKLLPLLLSDEQITAIEDLAAVNYSPEKIALYLDVSKEAFMSHYYNDKSNVRLAYDKGQLQAEFMVNQKQLELARSGNITAAQIFLKESERIRIDNIRKQVLFGNEY
jgi:hypothetical protein